MPTKLEAFLEVLENTFLLWRTIDNSAGRFNIKQMASRWISPNISDFNVIMINKQCKFSEWSAPCLHIGEEWMNNLKRKDK